jgi:hypothetical protein
VGGSSAVVLPSEASGNRCDPSLRIATGPASVARVVETLFWPGSGRLKVAPSPRTWAGCAIRNYSSYSFSCKPCLLLTCNRLRS